MTSLVDRLLPDELWQRIQPLLPAPPPRPRGGVPRQVPDRNCVARSSSWPVPRPRGACSRPRSWARPAASIWSESASTPSACGRSQGDLTGANPTGRRRRRPAKVHADKAYDHRRCRRYLRRRGATRPRIARRMVESSARAWPPPLDDRTNRGLAGLMAAAADPLRALLRTLVCLGHAGLGGDLLQRPPAAAMVTGKAFHDSQVGDRYRRGVPARIYLLGGSSSVGKTTAAAVIAERLGAVHLQLDSIARASTDPRVHRFEVGVDDLWRLPATHIVICSSTRATPWRRPSTR
jgi:hypothetical protein